MSFSEIFLFYFYFCPQNNLDFFLFHVHFVHFISKKCRIPILFSGLQHFLTKYQPVQFSFGNISNSPYHRQIILVQHQIRIILIMNSVIRMNARSHQIAVAVQPYDLRDKLTF